MPAAEERRLRATAKRRHYGVKRTNAYVYGTLRAQGWRPKKRKTAHKRRH